MKTVLVIDDFPEIRATVSAVLSEAGYRVLEADDYVTARQALENGGIDLVLCDLALPVCRHGSGGEKELSVEVGANAIPEFTCDFPDVPIIAFSGVVSESSLQEMKELGAMAVLGKPFTEEELLKVAKSICPLP